MISFITRSIAHLQEKENVCYSNNGKRSLSWD